MSHPYQGPELLADSHNIESFDCGDDALNDWLRRHSVRNQRSRLSRTWVVTEGAQRRVVAFYASSTAAVARSQATRKAARNQPDPLPAMLLGRLAVDHRHQGRGLASALLKHFLLKALEFGELTGLRLVLVHAKNEEAANFYRHLGFEPSRFDPWTPMLLVKDIRH